MPGPGGAYGHGRHGRTLGRPAGPAFRPAPPRPVGRFFGGPGIRPGHGHGPPRRGPWGGPWCCWPLLCVVFFSLLVCVGVSVIQMVFTCAHGEPSLSQASGIGEDDTSTSAATDNCEEFEAIYIVALAILMLCCCCCLMGKKNEGYDRLDSTAGEREHMLATEVSPPPPPVVYGVAKPIYTAQV